MIADEWVQRVRAGMTELPRVMAARFVADYGLSDYDATALTQSRAMAAYFEATAKACGQAKLAGNWIMGEVSRRLNEDNLDVAQCPIAPDTLAWLITLIDNKTISNNAAKTVFNTLWERISSVVANLTAPMATVTASVHDGRAEIDALIDQLGLKQMNDSGALEKIVDEVLAANPKNVEQYQAGNGKALNALVGQIMKGSQGKANPQQVNELLRQKLG